MGDFIAGRAAAKDALAQVGILAATVASGTNGESNSPPGTGGSISHAAGIAVAATARSDVLAAIGVDIELSGAVTNDVWSSILQETELAFLQLQPEKVRDRLATAIFCLKEAFYKFQYPQTRQWLEFDDLGVLMDQGMNQCRLTPRQPIEIGGRSVPKFPGYYRIGETLTIAAVF